MPWWGWFLLGLFIGTNAGVLILSWTWGLSRESREEEERWRREGDSRDGLSDPSSNQPRIGNP